MLNRITRLGAVCALTAGLLTSMNASASATTLACVPLGVDLDASERLCVGAWTTEHEDPELYWWVDQDWETVLWGYLTIDEDDNGRPWSHGVTQTSDDRIRVTYMAGPKDRVGTWAQVCAYVEGSTPEPVCVLPDLVPSHLP